MCEQIRDDLRVAYDANAAARDGAAISDWKAEERGRFLAQLKKEKKTRLLEIGAGPGRDGVFFRENGLSVVCTDLSPAMVDLCRNKGLEAHVMDLLDLDFPAQSFEGVFALNCLLHVPKSEIRAVLAAIRDLLEPSGIFYMGVYGGKDFEGIWQYDHHEPKRFFALYTDRGMRALVSEFFELFYFRRIGLEGLGTVHFQSMMLRNRGPVERPSDH